LEDLGVITLNLNVFKDRRVVVTGHTGFKGSWLTQWLLMLGAKVHGLALNPEPHERLFGQLNLSTQLASDVRHNILDLDFLTKFIADAKPEFVFHLAAQPLVRKSYEIPVETFATNVLGTVNVLESLRLYDAECTVVVVTTDKCYENREWLHAYREEDPMGGHDPYSASKGCAELAVSAYRRSFFSRDQRIKLASARAGNVIGGGDWAIDRIVPDVFRSLFSGKPVPIRNKTATRPWQHVLEPLSGYLCLAERLYSTTRHNQLGSYSFCEPFNFGPKVESNRTVLELVEEILKSQSGSWVDESNPDEPHEASKLNLAIDKAYHKLGWQPAWDFEETVRQTVAWYVACEQGEEIVAFTAAQIRGFQNASSKTSIASAQKNQLNQPNRQ
jgi:CDP-glucose 4,6-dehydratase